jgi:hypothetical protein
MNYYKVTVLYRGVKTIEGRSARTPVAALNYVKRPPRGCHWHQAPYSERKSDIVLATVKESDTRFHHFVLAENG